MHKKQSKLLQNYIKYSLNENKEYKTVLDVFDFDSTLYRSKEMPEEYKGPYWWNSKVSLEDLDHTLWIEKTVSAAESSINNDTHLSIMLTARADRPEIVYLVNRLLREKGLMFERSFFKNTNQPTPIFKAELVGMLLDAYPNIHTVNLWEDNEDNIHAIQQKCQRLNVDFNATLV